jgi:hypothetical protein
VPRWARPGHRALLTCKRWSSRNRMIGRKAGPSAIRPA